MTMRDDNDDILHEGATDAEGLDAELVSMLDRLGASDRSGWSEADSARVASATGGLVAAQERPLVVGSIGPDGAVATKRGPVRTAGGMGWLTGLAAAAAVGVVVGVGVMLSQPSGTTGGAVGGPLALGTPGPTALDHADLEEELSAWLASRVRLDPVALLSVDSQSDSLDELETDLAAFWTMRSELASVDDGFEVEGTL